MHVVARETWTDERLDDLTKHMDQSFAEVRAELRQQRGEMARQRDMDGRFDAQQAYMDGRFDAQQAHSDARFAAQQAHMDARFDALERTMQIGFTLIGAVLVGLIGLIGTQL
jgi:hypothetical protein